jgi:hypothetical protein
MGKDDADAIRESFAEGLLYHVMARGNARQKYESVTGPGWGRTKATSGSREIKDQKSGRFSA